MNKVSTISTIKAPTPEIIMFVNYHLNIGIDRVIIFFDDPQDPAIDSLKDYDRVTCVRCDDSYWEQNGGSRPLPIEDRQVINNNNGLQMVRRESFQWAIFIDHDELVYSDSNLKCLLSRADADVIRFKIYEAVSEKEDYVNIYDTALFKVSARSFQIWAAMLLGCKRAFFEGKYFRGHMDSKVAIRLSADIKRMGIHGPQLHGNRILEKTVSDIMLLHFDCVGMDAWRKKRLGRLEISSIKGLRGHHKKQQEIFAQALQIGGEELSRLYRENYIVPKYEQIVLRMLNMLATVHINKKLFESPQT